MTHFEAQQSDKTHRYKLVNDALTDQRTVEFRRIIHYDTNKDKEAQDAVANDPTLKIFYIADKADGSVERYARDGKTGDKEQWAETEVILKHEVRASGRTNYIEITDTAEAIRITEADTTGGAGTDQEITLKFNNKYLILNSEESQLDEHPFDSKNVIDPFQNIVNMQLSVPEEILLCFSPADTSTPNPPIATQITKDGLKFEDGFGKVYTAASGLGMTVAEASTRKQIVFGKPRDGATADKGPEACFMKITHSHGNDSLIPISRKIERGLSDGKGGIKWSAVKDVSDDSGTYQLSFAGGAFFVSSDDADSKAFLYVSFDGVSFKKVTVADNPNKGEDGQNGSPWGASVTFRPNPDDHKTGLYVHTGGFERAYTWIVTDTDDGRVNGPFHTGVANFWSATSTDGLKWATTYNMGRPSGGDAEANFKPGGLGATGSWLPSVAFGNDVFVAAIAYQESYDYYQFGNALNMVEHVYGELVAIGVATSTNGSSWKSQKLGKTDPGVWDVDEHGIIGPAGRSALIGWATGVIFCKTPTDTPNKNGGNYKGFFLLTGWERNTRSADPHFAYDVYRAQRWKSFDGTAWTKVDEFSDKSKGFDVALSVHRKNADPEKVIKD